MSTQLDESSITFSVDAVTPSKTPLVKCKTHHALERMLSQKLESCSDYHEEVVTNVTYQPLLAAVYMAFSQHRPLTLTPDAVWITITQGVAHHMVIYGETLRERFVNHQGKLKLKFTANDWVAGSPENPWPEAFESWTDQIREHVGPDLYNTLVCDFSTTGPVELAASQVTMMDVFERYFHYVMYCVCGIPEVTLQGSLDDWKNLKDKADQLRVFDMDWWLDHLIPICQQFVRARQGDIDLDHWKNICKLEDMYGGPIINGWVCKLFPYLREFADGPCKRKNPMTHAGFTTSAAPPGLSRVPFTWVNGQTGQSRPMEAIGGLVGVTQDPESLALCPKVGWGILAPRRLDVLLMTLEKNHQTFPKYEENRDIGPSWLVPEDLMIFYGNTNGSNIGGVDGKPVVQLVPREELKKVSHQTLKEKELEEFLIVDDGWFRLALVNSVGALAINFRPEISRPLEDFYRKQMGRTSDEQLIAICYQSNLDEFVPGNQPVIELSFTYFLERLLENPNKPYWLEPDFVPIGFARDCEPSM